MLLAHQLAIVECMHVGYAQIRFQAWQEGRYPLTRRFPAFIKRYLISKFGERCSLCGWDKRHSLTGNVPIEIDHIDGNWRNNSESNLRLVCPELPFSNTNVPQPQCWARSTRTQGK